MLNWLAMSLYLITCKYSISSIRHARSSFSPDMPLSSCILSNLLFLGDLSPTVSSPPDPAGQYGSPVQFSSVQSCLTLCDPMNSSMPGFPVHNQLLELAQTHVHRVSNAIQPSHPLSSPSPPASNPSQHQSFPMSQLFTWGSQSIGVSALASVLPKNTQGWSPLEWTRWISLQSKGLSKVFSNTTVEKHQFFGAQLSSQSNSHIHTWLLEKP